MTADEIKSYRSKKGWSQKQLAEELGVSIHAVQAWEQGKNPVPSVVEKHLLTQRDLSIPIDLILEISQFAKDQGITFDDALFQAIKTGLSQRPKSKKPGKKGE